MLKWKYNIFCIDRMWENIWGYDLEISSFNPGDYLSLDSSIEKVEEKINILRENENLRSRFLKEYTLNTQLSDLIELREDFSELKTRWITDKTKFKLSHEFGDLYQDVIKNWDILDNVESIKEIINKEKEKRTDTNDLITRNPTMRDFVEKNINFNLWLSAFKNNEAVNKFCDIFTLEYLNFLYREDNDGWLELLHRNLKSRKWLYIESEKLDELVRQSIVWILKKWYLLEKTKITINLSNWEKQNFNLRPIIIDEWKEALSNNYEDIWVLILELDNNLNKESIKNILSLIDWHNLLYNKLSLIYKLKFPNKLLWLNLLEGLSKKLENIIKEEISNIEARIDSNKENIDISQDIKKIKTLLSTIKSILLKEFILKFDITEIEKDLKIRVEKKYIDFNISHISKSMIWKLSNWNLKNNLWLTRKRISELQEKVANNNILPTVLKIKYYHIIDKFNDNIIEKLLGIYILKSKSKEIEDRWDISHPSFQEQLAFGVDRWEIDIQLMKKIIIKWYHHAFKKEFVTNTWKKGLNNLKKYESRWREIFWEILWETIWNRKVAEDLFLLTWVEGNAVPRWSNSKWAVWYFQILPTTAEGHWMKNISDLNDPIKSAKIAANYLLYLYKKADWNSIDEKIYNSILEYNWGWSKRLQEHKKENINNTILEVSKWLNWCNVKLRSWKWTVIETINSINYKVHNKNFNASKEIKWEYHFWILDAWKIYQNKLWWKKKQILSQYNNYLILKRDDKNIKSWLTVKEEKECMLDQLLWKNKITDWIEWYRRTILNQQHMYPEQFIAAKLAYDEMK